MTITTQNPPKSPAVRSGFQSIPTRIRDVREAQVPPLVVATDQQKEAIAQNLGELATKLAEIHRTSAEAWLSQGSYENALPHLVAATTFAPTESEYLSQLGFVRYVIGDDTGAIEAFHKMLGSNGNDADAWFNLGMVLFGQDRHGEAEDCFRRSLENEPNDAQTWNNRGVCLWRLQRLADARTCFQRALQLDPTDVDASFNLANAK